MVDDDTRRAILARRAQFVAAAIAGLVASGCERKKDDVSPATCLSVVAPRDGGSAETPPADAEPRPQVCLSPMPPPRDGGNKPL